MIMDKPSWVKHGDGNTPIYAIDVHPDGSRVATAGGDGRVNIWSVSYIKSKLKAKGEEDKKANKGKQNRFATLADHKGPANVVRFSKGGRFIASGGDDQLVIVYELRPGVGQKTGGFGSSRLVNLENWVKCMSFSGHSNNVVDLNWSPDDSMLASCSLDNTVRIWNTSRGTLVKVLQDHTSFVKGVIWDPVGKYIASQSDDRSVIIRTVEGWETVSKITEPFVKAAWNTFSTRLDWCPDGSHVTAVNAYQNPRNTAAILMRGSWKRTHDYVGHKGPVVASRYNPCLFKVEREGSSEIYTASCLAVGSQDNKFTVWISQKSRPALIGRTFFEQSVIDLAWSPDGLTLFVASIDGSIAVFEFEEKELGVRIPSKEVQELMRKSYGTVRASNAIAEDPDLMQLEQEYRKPKQTLSQSRENTAPNTPSKVDSMSASPKKASQALSQKQVIQQEVRQSDGRRRIAPVPLGQQTGQPLTALKPKLNGNVAKQNGHKETANHARERPAIVPSPSKRKLQYQNGEITANGTKRIHPEAVGLSKQKGGVVSSRERNTAGSVTVLPKASVVIPKPQLRQRFSVKVDSCSPPTMLEIQNIERQGLPGVLSSSCEIVCLRNEKKIWKDKHAGHKVSLAVGCENLVAVAFEKGILQVYSKSGRRTWPPLCLGSDFAFVECKRVSNDTYNNTSESQKNKTQLLLMAVTTEGKLHIWDVEKAKCVLQSNIASIAGNEGASKVNVVRLSSSGSPLMILDNKHALVYNCDFEAWVRVADGSHLFSEFSSTLVASIGTHGSVLKSAAAEINHLNAEATVHASVNAGAASKALMTLSAAEQRCFTGRHLEFMVSVAQILQSSCEFRRWLNHYVKFLTVEADEAKLRELCEDMLGPLSAKSVKENSDWNPEILGMNKKHILKTIVLPAIASNRGMQRLASEFLDILQEYHG